MASLKEKVRSVMSPAKANQTKGEIEQAFLEKLTLDDLPRRLYDELFNAVSLDWKQTLNPDILFSTVLPDSLFKSIVPYLQLGLLVLTLIFAIKN